jgi:fucose permease
VPLESLGLLLVTFMVGYLIASFNSGYTLNHVTPGHVLALCTLVMAICLSGYALSGIWWVLVGFVFIGGLGAGALDAGLNTIATINYGPRVVGWLHACYGLGATIGPLLMTGVIVSGWEWQWVYGTMAAGLLVLAASYFVTRASWSIARSGASSVSPAAATSTLATLRLPRVWLGIAMFIVYTGIEVTAGQWTFTLLTEARSIPVATAGTWVSFYWGALTVSRIGMGIVTLKVPVNRLLQLCLMGAMVGALLLWLNLSLWVNFTGIVLMGLALGPVFPSFIALTPSQVGIRHTANTVGFQITAAASGGGTIPGLVGFMVGITNLEAVSVSLLAGTILFFVLYQVSQWADSSPKC